jgi:hypothetical protein
MSNHVALGWLGRRRDAGGLAAAWLGHVGPGRIAATQIAPAIAAAPNSTLISVVSRDLGRATEFA